MSKLRLRLDISDLDELHRSGVIANIYDISDRPGKKKTLRDLVIPAGPSREPHRRFEEINLDPGQYVVEAILPSGEAISEEISIKESVEPQELELHAEESPHEWLRWHQFSGTVEQKADVYQVRRRSILDKRTTVEPESYLVSAVTSPPIDRQPADLSIANALVSRGFFFALESLRNREPSKHLLDTMLACKPADHVNVSGPLQPFDSDEIYEVHSFDSDTVRQIHNHPGYRAGYRSDRFERHYLFTMDEGIPTQYCVLPIPWREIEQDGEARIEALLRHTIVDPNMSSGVDAGYRLSVVVRSPLVGSVIGYLGRGNLPAAATILKKARGMLFEKMANPLAAAAGAYVLLNTEQSEERDDWHRWVRNLMNWFPWLPDGAIQHAWVMLHYYNDKNGIVEARANLLAGYRRGLPLYSKGVSLLLEGLTLLANDARAEEKQDQEVEEALKITRQMALATNMRQPFTTVLL
jgi:hypothetical protein